MIRSTSLFFIVMYFSMVVFMLKTITESKGNVGLCIKELGTLGKVYVGRGHLPNP